MKDYRERLRNMISLEPFTPLGSKRKHHSTLGLQYFMSRESSLLSPFNERMRSLISPRTQASFKAPFQNTIASFCEVKGIPSTSIFSVGRGLDYTQSIIPLQGFPGPEQIVCSRMTEKTGMNGPRTLDITSLNGDLLQRNRSQDDLFNVRRPHDAATEALADAVDFSNGNICTTWKSPSIKFAGTNDASELKVYQSCTNTSKSLAFKCASKEGDLSPSVKAAGDNSQLVSKFLSENDKHNLPSVQSSDEIIIKDRHLAGKEGPGATMWTKLPMIPVWKKLHEKAKQINPKETVDLEAIDLEAQLKSLRLTREDVWGRAEQRRKLELENLKRKDVADAFTSLSSDAEEAVEAALHSQYRNRVLVTHEKSNIDITGEIIQCLLPGGWLNDEVINLYLDLLKERELREPQRFLKCHFFNTFFYNKLFKDKGSYDYKAVRRWTTPKKLGYSLIDCEKILIPIHKDIHWCLAVINIREKKLEYMDSLKGTDEKVLQVLRMDDTILNFLNDKHAFYFHNSSLCGMIDECPCFSISLC